MILNRAIGILRHQMETMTSENTYPPADDCTEKRSCKYIPPLVLRLRYGADTAACSLVHNLVYNSTNIITPIHLGIAILVHHNHGSRSWKLCEL